MAKPDLLKRNSILCNLEIIDHVFLPHDKVQRIHKIGSLLSKSGLAIQFLFKFCFRNYDYNVKIVRDLRVQISVLATTKSQVEFTVCQWFQKWKHPIIEFCKKNQILNT